jgi:hypothetical protein
MLFLGLDRMVMPVLVIAVQNAVEHRDLGVATSSNAFFRSLGGAFGTAVFGAILTARLGHWMPRLLPAGSEGIDPRLLMGSPEQIRALDPVVQSAVVEPLLRRLLGVPVGGADRRSDFVVLFIPESVARHCLPVAPTPRSLGWWRDRWRLLTD